MEIRKIRGKSAKIIKTQTGNFKVHLYFFLIRPLGHITILTPHVPLEPMNIKIIKFNGKFRGLGEKILFQLKPKLKKKIIDNRCIQIGTLSLNCLKFEIKSKQTFNPT